MRIITTIRAHDWWDHKIPSILAIAYGTLYLEDGQPVTVPGLIGGLLFLLVTGAIFVSVLNDLTDIDSDRLAGKQNRLADKSRRTRRLIVAAATLLCLASAACLAPDWLSIGMYLAAMLSYVLYSCEPFRYKNRRFAGLITDSTGSQMFPALLTISVIAFAGSMPLNRPWFWAVALWSFAYGLRGILWHQLSDRKNDLKSGTRTFAADAGTRGLRSVALCSFAAETLSLAVMLYLLHSPVINWCFLGYLISLALRAILFRSRIVIAESPDGHNKYHLLFLEFYQLFLPLSLLAAMAARHPRNWIVFLLHALLFHRKLFIFLRDIYRIFEPLVHKKYVHHD